MPAVGEDNASASERAAPRGMAPSLTGLDRVRLSRDSQFGQRIRGPLAVEICDGVVDGVVERDGVGEGLVGEVMGLEVAPDRLDVIEFGRVFRLPLDKEPG